ncbi:MAG: antiporter [Gallionella sp.]|nr:antiporter [Gallionella sp.]
MIDKKEQRGSAGAEDAADYNRAEIVEWDAEDNAFWESTGKKIAYRNLWISIPSLLLGLAVWMMWGIIAVQMGNLGFPFKTTELFTLAAIAGLMGATFRIPAPLFSQFSGGRNTIFLATVLLMIPAIGTGIVLQDKTTPLFVFQILAFLSGIGGGNFACAMSNISGFFPERLQSAALELSAGLGNFGVATMQILIPLVMTAGIFGALAGAPMTLVNDSGWILGKILASTPTYIQNAGFVWLLVLVPLAFFGFFGMSNLLPPPPKYGGMLAGFAKILYLWGLTCIVGAVGLYLYLPAPTGLGLLNMWIALPLIIVATLFVMKLAAFGEMKVAINKQFAIFSNKHTWSLAALHLATFGSFIGFSMALPLAITVIFGVQHIPDAAGIMQHTPKNPNAPSALTYVWIGPFIGALICPLGGWIADKIGGSIVTQIISAIMVVTSATVGYVMLLAYKSATPEVYFMVFMILFVMLFAATGLGCGSTSRTVCMIFDHARVGPVLGWTSAIAAYGAFIAPSVIGAQIKAGTPEYSMYGFAVFYTACLVLNWWFYLRSGSEIKNP